MSIKLLVKYMDNFLFALKKYGITKRQNGFSFVELNIAISLFLIAAVAAIGVLSYCTLGAKKTMELSQSAHLAQSKMAELMYMNADQITEVTTPRAFPSPFNKYFYTVIKSDTTNPRLSGLRELKITITGSTGAQTTLVKLIRGAPATWAKTYLNEEGNEMRCIKLTADGGYVIVGSSRSLYSSAWIIKFDSNNQIQWQKLYPSWLESVYGLYIQQTRDNQYIVLGKSEPSSWRTRRRPLLLLKLNSNGTLEWKQRYIGYDGFRTDQFQGSSIQQTTDGGYIIVGSISTENTSFAFPINKAFVIKLSTDENDGVSVMQWQKVYTGSTRGTIISTLIYSIQQTRDGGYISAGFTSSRGTTGVDGWILKLDSSGNIQWQKTYGGNNTDKIFSIQQTYDDGYIAAGETSSFGSGYIDAWILKLDSFGNIQWQKTYGGRGQDSANYIRQTADSGYITTVSSDSFALNLSWGERGDLWILKLNYAGDIQWQKKYSSSLLSGEWFASSTGSLVSTADGGYLVAARANVRRTRYSYNELWLVLKIDSNGNCPPLDMETKVSPIISHANESDASPYIELDVPASNAIAPAPAPGELYYYIFVEDTNATERQIAP